MITVFIALTVINILLAALSLGAFLRRNTDHQRFFGKVHPGHPFTPEQKEKIIYSLTKENLSPSQVSLKYHVPYHRVRDISYTLRNGMTKEARRKINKKKAIEYEQKKTDKRTKNDIRKKNRDGKLTSYEKKEIKSLLKEGMSVGDIAKKLNRKYGCIYYHIYYSNGQRKKNGQSRLHELNRGNKVNSINP